MSDELPFDYPDRQGPSLTVELTPRRHRHRWVMIGVDFVLPTDDSHAWKCRDCGAVRDEIRSRRGRQSRNYGNRAELKASRLYGGQKVGHAGGPVDIRGKEWNTQSKTHRRLPPREWTKAFAALEASGERLPRLLLRFLPGPGLPPIDFFVVPGKAWLDWWGRDE